MRSPWYGRQMVGLRFRDYDEPTWFLLAFIVVELVAVIVLLAVLVVR